MATLPTWEDVRARFQQGAVEHPDISADWDARQDRWTFARSEIGYSPEEASAEAEKLFKEAARSAVRLLANLNEAVAPYAAWLDLIRKEKRGFQQVLVFPPGAARRFRQFMEADRRVDFSDIPLGESGSIPHVFQESADFCEDLAARAFEPEASAMSSALREGKLRLKTQKIKAECSPRDVPALGPQSGTKPSNLSSVAGARPEGAVSIMRKPPKDALVRMDADTTAMRRESDGRKSDPQPEEGEFQVLLRTLGLEEFKAPYQFNEAVALWAREHLALFYAEMAGKIPPEEAPPKKFLGHYLEMMAGTFDIWARALSLQSVLTDQAARAFEKLLGALEAAISGQASKHRVLFVCKDSLLIEVRARLFERKQYWIGQMLREVREHKEACGWEAPAATGAGQRDERKSKRQEFMVPFLKKETLSAIATQSGVIYSSLHRWHSGESRLRTDNVNKLAEHLKVDWNRIPNSSADPRTRKHKQT